TAHGGMTSHAAVVARGMGKPCVAGCEGLSIDLDKRTIAIGGEKLSEGDVLTIDGGSGKVIVGPVDLVPPQINEDFETILGWADELRRLKVRANADTPEDAAKAREFGAQGIGLCRTEHMFMAENRLPVMCEMQVRAIVRAAAAVEERTGEAPLVEIMHPLVGFAEELHRLRSMTVATANEEREIEYLVGTMIELPRACIRADEIAEYA